MSNKLPRINNPIIQIKKSIKIKRNDLDSVKLSNLITKNELPSAQIILTPIKSNKFDKHCIPAKHNFQNLHNSLFFPNI